MFKYSIIFELNRWVSFNDSMYLCSLLSAIPKLRLLWFSSSIVLNIVYFTNSQLDSKLPANSTHSSEINVQSNLVIDTSKKYFYFVSMIMTMSMKWDYFWLWKMTLQSNIESNRARTKNIKLSKNYIYLRDFHKVLIFELISFVLICPLLSFFFLLYKYEQKRLSLCRLRIILIE